MWLDRGELDKIVERSAPPPVRETPDHERERHDDDRRYSDKPYKKLRESLLGEIFDF